MIDKIKNIHNRLNNDPKFQEQVKKMKPKKSILGFLGVMLFFFVPEILNDFYSKEVNEWIYNYALTIPSQKMQDSLIWLAKYSFDGEISYLNITLGLAFLFWLFKD